MSDLIDITTQSGYKLKINKNLMNSATLLFLLRDLDKEPNYQDACDVLELLAGGKEQRKNLTKWMDEHSEGGIATIQDLMVEIKSIIDALGEEGKKLEPSPIS